MFTLYHVCVLPSTIDIKKVTIRFFDNQKTDCQNNVLSQRMKKVSQMLNTVHIYYFTIMCGYFDQTKRGNASVMSKYIKVVSTKILSALGSATKTILDYTCNFENQKGSQKYIFLLKILRRIRT